MEVLMLHKRDVHVCDSKAYLLRVTGHRPSKSLLLNVPLPFAARRVLSRCHPWAKVYNNKRSYSCSGHGTPYRCRNGQVLWQWFASCRALKLFFDDLLGHLVVKGQSGIHLLELAILFL